MVADARLMALGVLVALASSAGALAATTLTVDTRAVVVGSGKSFALKLSQHEPGDISLKVYDADGKFVRFLAEKYLAEKQLAVSWNARDAGGKPVEPGTYTVRFESGLRLKLDRSFAADGLLKDKAFKNPGVLRLDKQGNLYLLDLAAATVFKFTGDGEPVKQWKGKNSFTAPAAPYWGGLAVEPDGSRIYLSETPITSHVVDVYDGRSATRLFQIGGFFGDDPEWKKEKGGIAYPMWLGLNGDSKLYTDNPGYGRIWAFDRRKEGKAAGVWQIGGKYTPRIAWHSPGDCGDTDGTSAIYMASYEYHKRAQLFKIIDMGESATFAYDITKYTDPRTKKEVELGDIYGVAYDGQKGIWLIQRSPPRILKMADEGIGFEFVAALGSKGKNAAKLEFLAPRGAAVSPDGKFLYVVEDGSPISKSDETPGQARVARYKIGYAQRKTLKLTVRP